MILSWFNLLNDIKYFRFYDVNDGSIIIDGKDLKSLNASYLRGNVLGYIDQEPILFATSIMENIRYGKPDATNEDVRNFLNFIKIIFL